MADKKYKITFELSDGSEKSVEFTSPQGDPGKSAYEYACDGGYSGTEEEFAKNLASDNTMTDRTTGKKYKLYVDNGKLMMEEVS